MSLVWFSIIIVGILTFLTRFSFIVLSGKVKVIPNFQHALRFVPIVVLSAIIVREMIPTNYAKILLILPRFLAGTFAIFIAWRTRNIILTIITGMLSLYLLNYLINILLHT